MKLFHLLALSAILLGSAGCASHMLPAHDVDIPRVCKREIEVLKNPKYPPNSKEKYRAALSIAKKVDFSYTKNFDFVASIFDPKDMRTDNPKGGIQMVIFYYYYGDSFVTFSFSLYGKKVTHSDVKIKE